MFVPSLIIYKYAKLWERDFCGCIRYTIITSISHLAGILTLIVFVAGCTTIQETYGISPTDLSYLHPGMKQLEVEEVVGNPITEPEETASGYSVVYRFNRGYLPPDENKMARAVFLEVFNILSVGTGSFHTYNHQKALLDVEYDKDGKLLYALESMEVDCGSLPCGASCISHDCFMMQGNYLYPSTLPLSVSKHYKQQLVNEVHTEAISGEIRKRAEKGDTEAMYIIFDTLSSDIKEPVVSWEWLCKSADQGYVKAQFEISHWYRTTTWELEQPDRLEWLRDAGVRADDQVAYLWYTLAARGDEGRLRDLNNLLYGRLTEEEIEEAEEMIRNWKPGQCQRDLILTDPDN